MSPVASNCIYDRGGFGFSGACHGTTPVAASLRRYTLSLHVAYRSFSSGPPKTTLESDDMHARGPLGTIQLVDPLSIASKYAAVILTSHLLSPFSSRSNTSASS